MEDHHELNKSIGGAHIVRFIKAQKLKWWVHIHRMEECRMVRRILEWSPMGKRKRTQNRWWAEGYWSIGYEILDKGGDGQIGFA
jgi:hypothetical protein